MPPDAPIAEITMEIEDLLSEARRNSTGLDASIHFQTLHAGYTLPEKGPIVDALQAVFAKQGRTWETAPFPSHSDANQLWTAGVKPVMLGCGQLGLAHTPDESVHFEQVVAAAEIYYQTAVRLLDSVGR